MSWALIANPPATPTPTETAPSSAGKPICGSDGLQSHCEFLKKNDQLEEIKLTDGTSFKNPYAKVPMNFSGLNYSEFPDTSRQATEAQVKVIKLFSQSPATQKLDDIFTVSLSSPNLLLEIGNDVLKAKKIKKGSEQNDFSNYTTGQVSVPWPPEKPTAENRKMTVKDFNKEFLAQLPTELREKYLYVAENYAVEMNSIYTNSRLSGGYVPSTSSPAPKIEVTENRKQKVKALVEEVRQDLLEEILAGRSLKNLSPDEQSLYDRIRLVQYDPSNQRNNDSPLCQNPKPNAFYQPASHSITICPNMMNAPDSELALIVGHELAHAIDPCNGRMPVSKVGRWTARADVQSGNIKVVTDSSFSPAMMIEFNDTGLTGVDPDLLAESPAEYAAFYKSGALTKLTQGVSGKELPYQRAYDCLVQQGQRETTPATISETAREYVRQNTVKSLSPEAYSAEVKRIEVLLSKHPQCGSTILGASNMGEAMSDLWGSKVQARFLERHPPRSELELLGSLGHFISLACVERDSIRSTLGKLPGTSLDLSNSIKEHLAKSHDSHSANLERLDLMIFTEPRLQKIWNCSPSARKSCQSLTPGSSTTSERSSGSPDSSSPAGATK